MTEICTSPFDGDEYYDINLIDELEMIIWCSSVALESADEADEIIDLKCANLTTVKRSNSGKMTSEYFTRLI